MPAKGILDIGEVSLVKYASDFGSDWRQSRHHDQLQPVIHSILHEDRRNNMEECTAKHRAEQCNAHDLQARPCRDLPTEESDLRRQDARELQVQHNSSSLSNNKRPR